ncbi:hypothetical protein LSM04_003334 [Trypanosoma melophagium]|uniref:uncharacterized protein n=1 Tax=Trypanosoma melophagium TaxID=715481 RepID=UPI00351A4C97|nr:hypothetical protein LSM04_003334 [Trypanosoma melophagium]
MFPLSPRENNNNTISSASSPTSSSSVRRVAAELFAAQNNHNTNSTNSSNKNNTSQHLHVGGSSSIIASGRESERGSPRTDMHQQGFFRKSKDCHDTTPIYTPLPPSSAFNFAFLSPSTYPKYQQQQQEHHQEDSTHPVSSLSSPSKQQTPSSTAIRMRQVDLLLREEAVLRRETEAAAREERLREREEKLQQNEERLAPKIATDTYRQQLQELKCTLEARERELTESEALLQQQRTSITTRAAIIEAREREMDEQQELLLQDTRERVERIQQSARAVQAKELTVTQREEACKQREADVLLQRESLISWEHELRRREEEYEAKMKRATATAEFVDRREGELRLWEQQLSAREAALWETAAAKVPQGRVALATLMDLLAKIRGELHHAVSH